VAGIVSGREKAHKLPGYAGEVQALESLTPLWGVTKKGLIVNSLYWPTSGPTWTRVEAKEQPDSTLKLKQVKPTPQTERA
jgi:hypothetical protein